MQLARLRPDVQSILPETSATMLKLGSVEIDSIACAPNELFNDEGAIQEGQMPAPVVV
jgi:hypothetical protein